jgi:ATP-dependent Lon protease
LEREVARLARKSLRKILEGKEKSVTITPENLADFAGVRKFRHGVSDEENQVGAVTGLAWTEVGGELLTIESVTVPGKGAVKTTGKLGEVMSESVQMAFSFVKARAPAYGIKPSIFNRKDLHIHLPEGAVPKDGPSAGIGMVTAMVSTLTGIPVRADVAMTGEVTLRGRVLAIGGLKEKLLAALRGGIKTVLIPEENARIWPRSRQYPRRAGDRAGQPCRSGSGPRAGRAAGDRMDRGRRLASQPGAAPAGGSAPSTATAH